MACCCRSGIWCMYFSVLDSLYGQDSPLRLRALLRCFEEEFNAEKNSNGLRFESECAIVAL